MLIFCRFKYQRELIWTPDHYAWKYSEQELDWVPPCLIPVFEMLDDQRLLLGVHMEIPIDEVINQQVTQ